MGEALIVVLFCDFRSERCGEEQLSRDSDCHQEKNVIHNKKNSRKNSVFESSLISFKNCHYYVSCDCTASFIVLL